MGALLVVRTTSTKSCPRKEAAPGVAFPGSIKIRSPLSFDELGTLMKALREAKALKNEHY